MREYLDRFDPRFEGLVAPVGTVARAAEGLHISYERPDGSTGGHDGSGHTGGYEVDHGTYTTAFVDGKAKVVWSDDHPGRRPARRPLPARATSLRASWTSPRSPAPPTGSGTSARSRSGPTRCASSRASSLAIWVGERRWVARGGRRGDVTEIATWMVPFGIIGGRIYHVITSPQAYFGDGGDPVKALYIWQGGLGIWGAIAFGGVGAWIGCRRRGIPLPAFADALAPGIVLAQAVGRLGNYFNQELYGRRDRPAVGARDRPRPPAGRHARPCDRTTRPSSTRRCGTSGSRASSIWADRRFRLGHGRAFALYVAAYTVGRGWIEGLRVDPANHSSACGSTSGPASSSSSGR